MKMALDLGSYSYDGLPEEDQAENKQLTWNRDPVASLSDWSIIVRSKSAQEETNIYYVHKCVMGAGPRGSQYFLKLFTTSGFEESQTCTSKLDLDESAARAFPDMLDFIYAPRQQEVNVTTETAVAMRHLSNYFGVPSLFESTNKFIQEDIDTSNIHIYLKEAQQYNDQRIVEATKTIFNRVWRDLLVSEDRTKIRQSAYMNLLEPSEQVDLLKVALLNEIQTKESEQVIRKDEIDCDHALNEEGKISYKHLPMNEQCLPIYYFDEHSKQWIQSDDGDIDYVQRDETETIATEVQMDEDCLPIYYFDEDAKRWVQAS